MTGASNLSWQSDPSAGDSNKVLAISYQIRSENALASPPAKRPRREAAMRASLKVSQLYAPAILENDTDSEDSVAPEPAAYIAEDLDNSGDSDAYIDEPDPEAILSKRARFRKRKRSGLIGAVKAANQTSSGTLTVVTPRTKMVAKKTVESVGVYGGARQNHHFQGASPQSKPSPNEISDRFPSKDGMDDSRGNHLRNASPRSCHTWT